METTAAVLEEPIDSPDFTDTQPASIKVVEVDKPAREEVLVEVTAASLCHTDVASARGHIDEAYPLVMGHEGTGVVREIGEGVEFVEPGDHVVFGRITCGRCEYCRAGKGQHCVKRSLAGREGTIRKGAIRFSQDGNPLHHYHGVSSFSEYTVVNEEVAIPIPEELPPEQATLLGCGVFTGAGAVMNTADIEAGTTVAVFGTGGVGLSAIQGARIRGATTIVAIDLVAEKLDTASAVGATHVIDASAEVNPVDEIRQICEAGIDYAFDVVGHESVVNQAVDVLSPTGQAIIVGVPPQGLRDLSLDLFNVVTSEKSIIGSFNGSYSLPLAIPMLAELAVSGDLELEPLITDVKSLDEINKAMEDLESGTAIRQVLLP